MIHYLPEEIEARSFEIIEKELTDYTFSLETNAVVKRVIHTTADFDYANTLSFSNDAINIAIEALKKGACVVTDTQMAKSGINKSALSKGGGEVYNFISDEDVAKEAKEKRVTRASICMEKAKEIKKPLIFAIGNAPTALIKLDELIKAGELNPILIIGVPVGFVNVVESKELILEGKTPYIVAKGRKGGSNVAAAIVNALLYLAYPRE